MTNAKRSVQQLQRRLRCTVAHTQATTFFNLLTDDVLFEQLETLLPDHRERLFPPTETLAMFCAQALSADRSCQRAVNMAAINRLSAELSPCSTHTGAYCRARQRLPEQMVSTLARFTARLMTEQAPTSWHWRNRPVRLVDGTTVTLPDTAANQASYPQAHNQQPGLGFPICRIVGILCLGSGALLNAAICRYQGKGNDEQSMLRLMLGTLKTGEVLVGDALYAGYFLFCALLARGIDGVFEQHGARQRATDFRRGQRLGARDHIMIYDKPKRKPDWISQADYDAAPSSLHLRELQAGGKILVTTMLCPKATSKADLKALYRDRWHVELDLRNIKTTLGMSHLTCLDPQMVVKEIWVYLVAYNLIRMMMARAARLHGCQPRQLSFKHTVQIVSGMMQCLASGGQLDQHAQTTTVLQLIAQQRVGNRGGRVEPRAVKRRTITYSLLSVSRDLARAKIRKHGHPT
jgi:hypothetical protein